MLSHLRLIAAATAFAAWCAVACAAPRIERDILYGTAAGEQLKLDVYRPESDATSHPIVLLLHGGGWAGGDKKHHNYIGPPLANHGCLAFSANYRLAPKHKYPAGVQDCQEALRWVRQHAAEYGGDVNRLALIGESAGGHLCSLLGLWDWTSTGTRAQGATEKSRVRAVVNVFGPCDLSDFGEVKFCEDLVFGFLGGTTETIPHIYREVSPVYLLDNPSPIAKPGPAFLHLHGTADALVPVRQSQRFHARLKEESFDSTLLILDGANHGWLPESPHGKQANKAIGEFLLRTIGRE